MCHFRFATPARGNEKNAAETYRVLTSKPPVRIESRQSLPCLPRRAVGACRRGRLKSDLSKLAFFDSVHPHPLMPRWSIALNFVIPAVPACRGTGADADFLYRGTVQGDVCGFPLGKPHEVRQRHSAGQEIRGGGAQGRDLQFHWDRTQMPTSDSPPKDRM
jgi:hypothetical protein